MRRVVTITTALLTASVAAAQPGPPIAPAAPAGGPPGTTAPTAPASNPDDLSADDLRDVFPAERAAAVRNPDDPLPTTGAIRGGVYGDDDQTLVVRLLGNIAHTWDRWQVNVSLGVDSVTSASVDVRSSPALSKIDVVTSASGVSSTSGGHMNDTRYQVATGAGWKDGDGHGVNLTAAIAHENDYDSVSGGVNGAYDLLDRTVTLLGGVTVTQNWISSVLDTTLQKQSSAVGWSAGVARVVTRDDAVRLRYDGRAASGYLSSPYRNVRFGDFTYHLGHQSITFAGGLIGAAAGLPETEPTSRLSHAATLEWVHGLDDGVGLHPEVRVSHDSWSVNSLAVGADVRWARPTWRMQTGYRYYTQTKADFFRDRYNLAPATYTYYSADKDLGEESGHILRFDAAWLVMDPDGPGDSRLMFNLEVDAMRYSYPGFLFLSSRNSAFVSIGLTWEL